METRLRPARPADLPAARALLAAASLPLDGMGIPPGDDYVVAEEGSTLVGLAGLELHGADGLLRSVVVRPDRRGTGLGRALVEDRLARARFLGLRSVWLLTSTAPRFFEGLGFARAERASAPEDLQRSAEFASICPATAVVMILRTSVA